jgi:biopolymer transport protein ExbD
MGMTASQSENEPVAEINVTPMVDVLLCLLIIFMVATPDSPNEQMPLNIPRESVIQQPSDPNASLLVTIDAQGQARLGQTQLDPSYTRMVEQIAANEKVRQDNKVMVSADPAVPYGRVIRVMAAAHQAGVAEVGIASDRL